MARNGITRTANRGATERTRAQMWVGGIGTNASHPNRRGRLSGRFIAFNPSAELVSFLKVLQYLVDIHGREQSAGAIMIQISEHWLNAWNGDKEELKR